MKLGTAVVMTPDIEEARRFYHDLLGLPLNEAFPEQLIFEVEGGKLHVFRCERVAPPAAHGRDGASVITFEVTSIERAMREMRARGVQFIHDQPVMNAAARMRYAAFQAPGGNVHELIERM